MRHVWVVESWWKERGMWQPEKTAWRRRTARESAREIKAMHKFTVRVVKYIPERVCR